MDRFTTIFPVIALLACTISVTATPQDYDFDTDFEGFHHPDVMPIVIQGRAAAVTFSGGNIVRSTFSDITPELTWVTHETTATIELPAPASYLELHAYSSPALAGAIQLLDEKNEVIHEYTPTHQQPTHILLEGTTEVKRIQFLRKSRHGNFTITQLTYDDGIAAY